MLTVKKEDVAISTLTASISAALATQGKDVLLVDADQQGTTSRWIADRQALSGIPVVHSLQKYDNI